MGPQRPIPTTAGRPIAPRLDTAHSEQDTLASDSPTLPTTSESSSLSVSVELDDILHHQPQQGPSALQGGYSGEFRVLQALSDVLKDTSDVDEDVLRRVVSREITIQDILKAGLAALSTVPRAEQDPPPVSATQNAILRTRSALRTDKILIMRNQQQEHARYLPDIYANCLSVRQFSVVAAARANAEVLGISFSQLTDPEAESPFYRGHESMPTKELPDWANVRNRSPCLHPTPSQFRHSHHPYIDVIPFPTFRQRLIDLLSMDPPMVDEDELCDDFSSGLICWGFSTPGENDATGSGAPWDLRSWEAQPWFLKKWWIVVGGTEGELFQQSKWWHEMRGDRLPRLWSTH